MEKREIGILGMRQEGSCMISLRNSRKKRNMKTEDAIGFATYAML